MLKLLVLCILGATAVNAGDFSNPLVPGGADPWMVYYNGWYYLLVTPWDNTISVRKSQTLEGLKYAENKLVYTFDGDICWAPEIHNVDGRWYLYYTACTGTDTSDGCHRNHVAQSASDDPMGPYTYMSTFIDAEDNIFMEIDPSLIWINGKYYLLGSICEATQDLYIRELTNPWTAVGRKAIISQPIYEWERSVWNVNEGPEALYHDGRTFVIFSASGCITPDYKLGLLEFVGTDPMNPAHWKKHPTALFERSDANGVYGPGHNGFFKSPDGTEDWIVYHANDNINGTCDGFRSPRAKKFTWDSDGLPVFGIPDSTSVRLTSPSGEP